MQIRLQPSGDLLEMHAEGRLDNETSVLLRQTVEDAVRQGYHKILLNLSQVTYLGSPGIAVLLHCFKQLQSIHGTFGVYDPSPLVDEVLRHTKVGTILMCDPDTMRGPARPGTVTLQTMSRVTIEGESQLEVYEIGPGQCVECRVLGSPQPLWEAAFAAEDCRRVAFPPSTFGLGLGALGSGFENCQSRFGEFLAVAGAAAQLPTHGLSVPDYLLATENYIPEVEVLYGVQCSGEFAQLARFRATDTDATVPLARLVAQCLALADTSRAGIVMLAECAGLVGAALRRSPALPAKQPRLTHPEIRDWLSFSAEHVHRHSLALIAGVAVRGNPSDAAPPLAALLRPLASDGAVWGHFHAAVFPYRPLKKRSLDLFESVHSLFDLGSLQDVMHLLNDPRPISGAGQTELLGGGCWIAPIDHIACEGD
jgi:anti-anti-sigma factor